MKISEIESRLQNAKSLEELAEILNWVDDEDYEIAQAIDTTHLPVFGGKHPRNTEGIYSWDPDSVLTHNNDWVIESREEWKDQMEEDD